MSKSSTTTTPSTTSYSPSVFKIGDKVVAKTYNEDGNIVSQIYQTDEEKAQSDQYAKLLNEYISKADSLSPEYVAQRDKIVDAFIDQGTKTIENTYNPMITDLQNNVASRFGTLNSSNFLDNLTDIQGNEASAISDLATNALLYGSQLDEQQRSNTLDYIDVLSGAQNSSLSSIYNALGVTSSLSDLINSFNLSNSSGTSTSSTSKSYLPFYLK